MTYKQGDILLIPVPFSDLASNKKRPVLVLSNDKYNTKNEDLIVSAITSNIRGLNYEVVFDSEDMLEGQLSKTSCIRPDKIYTLSKNIIVKKYGSISSNKLMEVKIRIMEILNN